MQDYLFMMRGSHAAFGALSPAEKQELMERYNAFVARLKQEGRFKSGQALSDRSRHLSAETGTVRVTDGPYPEAREALNGYFVVACASLEEAVAIGRDCPCLTHGETLEVIEVTHH
jgi:hypothetical protein